MTTVARARARLRGGRVALTAIATAALCGIGAVYLLEQQDAAETLERANALGTEGRFRDAIHEARRVSRVPAADRAPLVEAYAYAGLARLRESDRAFARAAAADPRNWVIYRDWARVQLVLGRLEDARATMGKARALNPRMTVQAIFHTALPQER